MSAEVTKHAWAGGFENWADCDTACFHLFDRTPHAWEKARQWASSPREFVKRGHAASMKVAKRLAEREEASCRWVGKDALRELSSPKVRSRLTR